MYVTSKNLPSLRSAGVTAEPVLLDLDAWIRVPYGGWPAWLDSFTSKRKNKLKSEDRNFRAAGYEIVHMRLAECYRKLGAASAGLLTPYPGLSSPIVVSSWGFQLKVSSPADSRLQRFVNTFRPAPRLYQEACASRPAGL